MTAAPEEPIPEPPPVDHDAEEGWGTLVFVRPSKLADMSRDYQIFMDGDYIGALAGGKQWTAAMPPGEHEFQAKIYWCSSKPLKVNLDPGFTYHIEIGCNVAARWRYWRSRACSFVPRGTCTWRS
jgi:hypothetical protein